MFPMSICITLLSAFPPTCRSNNAKSLTTIIKYNNIIIVFKDLIIKGS